MKKNFWMFLLYKETKIYESFTFWNKLQYIFHDILIVVDVPVGISYLKHPDRCVEASCS